MRNLCSDVSVDYAGTAGRVWYAVLQKFSECLLTRGRWNAAGTPIVPPVTKTLHYVPPNDSIGTLARVMTYVVFGVMGLTVIVAVAAGMASPGQSSTGTLSLLSGRSVQPSLHVYMYKRAEEIHKHVPSPRPCTHTVWRVRNTFWSALRPVRDV